MKPMGPSIASGPGPSLLTLRGQLALQVAREYAQSIGVGKSGVDWTFSVHKPGTRNSVSRAYTLLTPSR